MTTVAPHLFSVGEGTVGCTVFFLRALLKTTGKDSLYDDAALEADDSCCGLNIVSHNAFSCFKLLLPIYFTS